MKRVCKKKKMQKKRGTGGEADSLRIVHICVNPLCFVTVVFFSALSDEISRHKCCCVLHTYTGSSHSDNQRPPRGQVRPAILLRTS